MRVALVNMAVRRLKPYSLFNTAAGLKASSPDGQLVCPLVRALPSLIIARASSKTTGLQNDTEQKIILKQPPKEKKFNLNLPIHGIKTIASLEPKSGTELPLGHVNPHKIIEIYLGDEKSKTKQSLVYPDFDSYEKMFFRCPQTNELAVIGRPRNPGKMEAEEEIMRAPIIQSES